MSSNLPPGVTGNEYEIAGPDFERDEERACMIRDLDVRTISSYGESRIKHAIEQLSGAANVMVAVGYLRTALLDINHVEMDAECPFEGVVTVTGYQGVVTWECPLCRFVHEDEMEDL